jgi:hypothetical protein
MRVLEAALGILIVGLVLIGVLLLEIFPYPPSSLTGWVVLVVVGIPYTCCWDDSLRPSLARKSGDASPIRTSPALES